MKYSKLIILTALIFTIQEVMSQTELDIKSTGRYIYSWAYDNSEIAAREAAKIGLMDTIFVSLLKEPAVDQTDTIFIKAIDYFVKKVGFKWQAIAFADKSNIRIKLEERNQLKVIPVIIGDQRSNGSNLSIKKIDSVNDIPTTRNKETFPHRIISGQTIVDELMIHRNAASLEKQLIKFKSELKLNYGNKENYPDDTGCYIFIIDRSTLTVKAVFDKGGKSRKDLLNNFLESNYEEKYKDDYFIYVAIK